MELTINEMYIECFKNIPIGKEMSRKEIITELQKHYEIDEASILPSDLCYNSSNKGVEGNGKPRLFIKIKRGMYRYVGPEFDSSNVNPNEFGTMGEAALNRAKTGQFDFWLIKNSNLAAKETDKSVFEYNESGIPQEIRWFFEAEDLQPGERMNIILSYEEHDYSAYVKREAVMGRTRLIWHSELGEVFNEYYRPLTEYPILLFERVGEKHFAIKFLDGTQSKKIEPLDDTYTYEERVNQAITMDETSLRAAAQKHAKSSPIEKEVIIKQVARDPYIAEYAKFKAKGICQLCGKPAPFNDSKGRPYLESHHIVWIANGGEDTIENTVALCPNCHKKMHIVADETDVETLLSKIRNE